MPLYGFHCGSCDKDSELRRMERLVSRLAPAGRSKGLVQAARAQAAREGHLSNYSRKERGG